MFQIHVITLGVQDIAISRKFYEELGFTASSASNEHFVAFRTPSLAFCLYQKSLLAEDAHVSSIGSGFRAVTLAYNVSTKEAVDAALHYAKKCGATIVKDAQDVFWGGYSGYFSDPDGNLWEVAWNPHWTFGANGVLKLPD